MERLNYQHLFYFWNVAKEGSVSRASAKLHLAQPTISGQLTVFEDMIGEKLFTRDNKKLLLTETGQAVFHYAEEIFGLGRELTNMLQGRSSGTGLKIHVGISDALPKLITYKLLEPALKMPETVRLICYEDKTERLLADLSFHSIDLVLSDLPATTAGLKTFNHLLGECGVGAFGIAKLAQQFRPNFPQSLNDAPLLLPTASTGLRSSLEQWFYNQGIFPNIAAEIEDSALVKTFAAAGVGVFFAPMAIADDIEKQYGTCLIGAIEGVSERFYAITAQRKLQHPVVLTILAHAENGIF